MARIINILQLYMMTLASPVIDAPNCGITYVHNLPHLPRPRLGLIKHLQYRRNLRLSLMLVKIFLQYRLLNWILIEGLYKLILKGLITSAESKESVQTIVSLVILTCKKNNYYCNFCLSVQPKKPIWEKVKEQTGANRIKLFSSPLTEGGK
jgi:hypothetical protein